jgi:hypothetical protein
MRNAVSSLVLGALAAAGCASTPSVEGPVDSARELLATPRTFAVVPSDTMVQLDATYDRGPSKEHARVTIPVMAGQVLVVADGDDLVLGGLSIDLAAVALPTTIVQRGVELSDIHLRLAEPVRTRDSAWRDGDDGFGGDVTIALDLDWSIRIQGTAYPLAPQRLDGIDAGLMIGRDGATLTFDAGAIAPGVRWSWADLVLFGDFTIAVHAAT